MAAELIDDPRLAGLMLKEAWRRARHGLRTHSLTALLHRRAGEADRLAALPRDLERGRAGAAEAIYCGVFEFAGHRVELAGASPFDQVDAPVAWREALFSFEWLRDLSEVEDALACENARALVDDYLSLKRSRRPALAARPEIAARRLIAFLCHSPVVLARGEGAFRRRFLDHMAREARLLRRVAPETSDGVPRLLVRIALAYAALCLPGGGGQIRLAGGHLSAELDRQIFADGGHVSRNPQAIATLLRYLLPLRQLFTARNQPVPRGLFAAVDRMLPSLRFFLHADGGTALFNGAAAVPLQLLAALVRHDETLGEPMGHMRQSGYQRLSQGHTVLIADTGLAPPTPVSGEAHAGTLAFEFSSGHQRFVVNCGAPRARSDALRRMARMTAAHSTLTLADTSSSRFARSRALDRFLGGPLVAGPTRVPSTREDTAGGQRLFAAHDGYRAGFGLVHEREILLAEGGTAIEGTDRLHRAANRPRGEAPKGGAVVRFHLHPDVVVEQAGRGIRLAGGGEIWWFFCDQPAHLEDSILFSDPSGPRATTQIVAEMAPGVNETNWRFERQR
jgi:uncharacterized heparinase superfamily protein